MVLPASQAQTFTNNAIGQNLDDNVAEEVRRTEGAIRSATSSERYRIVYNARIVGNPFDDPNDDTNLEDVQISYRDVWLDAGYQVSRDPETGYWVIDWTVQGPEELVAIYSIRTTVTPGGISTQTIDQIDQFFSGVSPKVTTKTFIIDINGGDILETDFSAVNSIFYEYVSIVTQQNVSTDHAANLKTNLVANLASYTNVNVEVYKIA